MSTSVSRIKQTILEGEEHFQEKDHTYFVNVSWDEFMQSPVGRYQQFHITTLPFVVAVTTLIGRGLCEDEMRFMIGLIIKRPVFSWVQ